MSRRSSDSVNEENVFAEFTHRRKIITISAIVTGTLVGVAVVLLRNSQVSDMVAMALFVVVSVLAAIVNLKFWRCPVCNGHLGKLYLGLKKPKHCPACGVQLVAS